MVGKQPHFEREGVEGGRRETTPPSRVSSEGGSRVVERQPPPSRVSSEGGSMEVVEGRQLPPSRVSSEGGSMEVVEGRQLPPSRVSSEGGSRVWWRDNLPLSRISSEGGSRVVVVRALSARKRVTCRNSEVCQKSLGLKG